ncbi:MAG: YetF domain-containing protein [Acidimicrobiales bacterium]
MEIVARASVTFLALFLLTRGISKRSLGDLSPFEMILLVTLGDIIQQGITQEDYSVTGSMLAISTFGFWITVLTWITWRSSRGRRIIEGVPLLLVRDGEPIDAALAVERMPLEEVLEAARQNGVEDLADVKLAVLEVNGRISIIKRER